MSVETLPGNTAPFGFFDPLNISAGKKDSTIKRFRESELKHGRVAMLAALGILVGESVETNTPLFGDKIVGPAIYQFQEADQVSGFGFAFFIIGITAAIEALSISKGWESIEEKAARDPKDRTTSQLKADYISGDLGNFFF